MQGTGMQLRALPWPKFVPPISTLKNTWFLSVVLLQGDGNALLAATFRIALHLHVELLGFSRPSCTLRRENKSMGRLLPIPVSVLSTPPPPFFFLIIKKKRRALCYYSAVKISHSCCTFGKVIRGLEASRQTLPSEGSIG